MTGRGSGAGLRLAAAALALVAGAASIWLVLTKEPDRSAAQAPSWDAGARQRYAVTIDSRVGLVVPSESGARMGHLEQQLRGALHLRVFGMEGGGIRAGFQLADLDYMLAGQRNGDMETGLAEPFAVLFAPNGRPASFSFPKALDAAPRALLEELVRTFQLVLPKESDAAISARSWTSSEEHALGRYLAYHERRPDGVVRKRKTLYSRVELPFGSLASPGRTGRGAPGVTLRRSDATYRQARDVAWVEQVALDEETILTQGGHRVGDAVVAAELTLESTSPVAQLALYGDLGWQAMLVAASERLRSRVSPDESLADAAEVGDWIEALDASTVTRVRARKRLEEQLRRDPALARDVADAVRGEISPDVAASMIHALERVGDAEAQDALVGLMEDPELERRRRLQAIVAMGGLAGAGEGAIEALLGMSLAPEQGDLATTALLAVGAIGQTMRQVDPSRAAAIGEALQGSLRHAQDAQELGVALKAMGNMADPDFAESVAPYVDDDSAYVRASAAWALERTGADDQTSALADRLEIEESGSVRSAIVSALDELDAAEPAAIEVVSSRVLEEPDPNVRSAMVQYLGSHLEAHPENREVLALLALDDASPIVRRLAASAVTGGDHD